MSKSNEEDKKFYKSLAWLIAVVIFLFTAYTAFQLLSNSPMESWSLNSTGVFGDSYGVLTSLFLGLAFAGLIWTVLLQRNELELQRHELEETREEFKKSRHQALLRRVIATTQNQTQLLRAELRELRFRAPDSTGRHIGLEEMPR